LSWLVFGRSAVLILHAALQNQVRSCEPEQKSRREVTPQAAFRSPRVRSSRRFRAYSYSWLYRARFCAQHVTASFS